MKMHIAPNTSLDVRRVAIIPARGGSKRLPRKNILPLGGRPMLSWSVDAALQSGLFERVCVSTDDHEIHQVASRSGAEVLQRPEFLGSDSATVAQVCTHHLKEWMDSGESYDHLYCLYPTAPLRNVDDLRAIASIFATQPEAIAVVAVSKFTHYPHQALQVGADGELRAFWPELVNVRGSDLPLLVAGNGSTYAVSVPSFMQTQSFLPATGLYAHYMNPLRSIDVDTKDEYELLQLAFAHCERNAS